MEQKPMTAKEKFLCVISNDSLKHADAIVILEGGGFVRAADGVELYREGWAPCVVYSGGAVDPNQDIYPADRALPELLEMGVPKAALIMEGQSQNTRDQAVEVMKIVKEKGWPIILVASHYHQYRAFLTFLKAMKEADLNISLYNAPVRDLPWFEHDPCFNKGPVRRINLLQGEFERIPLYIEKGHVASFEEAMAYLEEREGR